MRKNSIYKIKPDAKSIIKEKMTQKELAEKVGISEAYVCEILNNNKRRRGISKSLAYYICKAISSELEIPDLFENVK